MSLKIIFIKFSKNSTSIYSIKKYAITQAKLRIIVKYSSSSKFNAIVDISLK